MTHSWQPQYLLGAVGAPPEPATIGGILYPGRRHLLSGEPEAIKSWTALALAVEQLNAYPRGAVVYIDLEMGLRETVDRLRFLDPDLFNGEVSDQLDDFHYITPEEPIGASKEIRADLDELIAVTRPSLVVIDSYTPALALHDLDPNSGRDIERFNRAVVDPLRAHGAAILILDHLVKVKENRGKFTIGSERKVGSADVHLGLEVAQPFGRGRHGIARIIVHKDRPGHLPRPRAGEVHFTSSPDTGLITWEIRPPEVTTDQRFRPTVLMEKVGRHLEAQTEPVSRNSVEEAVKGNRDYVRIAIDALVTEGYADETVGARRARLLTFLRPFSATSPDLAPTSPGRGASSTSPTSPAPLQRGEVRGEVRGANSDGPEQTTSPVDFAAFLDDCFQAGHLAEDEWLERRKLHALLQRAA